jgi:hypothetical protein
MAVPPTLALLEAEARFHRERLALYRARRWGSRPTSETRFRQLQRAADLAERRLQVARHKGGERRVEVP